MRPSHSLGRLSVIPYALRLTSTPDCGEYRSESQSETAGQRRAARGARPTPEPPPELLEGAWIANPSRAEERGRSRGPDGSADRETRQCRTGEPACSEGDVNR